MISWLVGSVAGEVDKNLLLHPPLAFNNPARYPVLREASMTPIESKQAQRIGLSSAHVIGIGLVLIIGVGVSGPA
jgi:hypothetical protein